MVSKYLKQKITMEYGTAIIRDPRPHLVEAHPTPEDVVRQQIIPPDHAIQIDPTRSGAIAHSDHWNQNLIATVQTGSGRLGIVQVHREGQPPATGLVEIRQRQPEYDIMNNPIMQPRFLTWLTPGVNAVVGSANFPALGAEVPANLCVLRADTEGRVLIGDRENQVTVELPDGRNHPDNPFDNMPWEMRGPDLEAMPQSRQTTAVYLPAREVVPRRSPEFMVGGNHFRLVGRDPAGYWVMTSTDSRGRQRHFMVYQSRSEGSWRVSQGREPYKEKSSRLLKGAEDSPDAQYTQDTQLHPEFRAALDRILDTKADEDAVPRTDLLFGLYSKDQARALSQDFEQQVAVLPLARDLDGQLRRMGVGDLAATDIQALAGSNRPQDMTRALRNEIQALNRALANADVIPDFTHPIGIGVEEHPILGPYASEVYAKTVNGRTLEWHMGRDSQGRVWIERIRFADSPATAYGTDSQLVYSGILTSKPLEYTQQCDGLPAEWRKPSSSELYEDITPFLEQLLPIQRYRQTAVTPKQKLIYAGGFNF